MSDNFVSTRNTIYDHEMCNNTSFNDLTMKEVKVMFGNSFCFLFSKTCFWEYKEKTNFFVFLKSKTCLVS